MEKAKNDNLKKELEPFVNALHDMVLADIEYLEAQQAIEEDKVDSAKEHYVSAQMLREQSLDYNRPMLDDEEEKAKTAAKRLQPIKDELEEHVMNNNEESLDLDNLKTFVQEYADKEEIKQDDARLLQTPLTSVEHYVEKESYDKAEKHMRSEERRVGKECRYRKGQDK